MSITIVWSIFFKISTGLITAETVFTFLSVRAVEVDHRAESILQIHTPSWNQHSIFELFYPKLHHHMPHLTFKVSKHNFFKRQQKCIAQRYSAFISILIQESDRDPCNTSSLGLVHTCRQNHELVSTDKVLRLFIDKLLVWTRDKKFYTMLDLFSNSL